MNRSRRSLCVVSRDPLQCSELVLSLQASLDPDDEVEIVMDRRRARDVFDTKSGAPASPFLERRHNPDVDLTVRTKGFAIVPAAPSTSRSPEEPDAEDRARFENILSFKRRHESRSGRVAGAAGAVVVALILAPPPSGFSGRVPRDMTTSAELTKSDVSGPAPRLDRLEQSVVPRTPEVAPPAPRAPSPGIAAPKRPNPAHPAAMRPTAIPPTPITHRWSSDGAIETYAARVEDATERAVAKAKGLIDRIKSEVIGGAKMNVGRERSASTASVTGKRRPADSP
jgi:hypothetical protein